MIKSSEMFLFLNNFFITSIIYSKCHSFMVDCKAKALLVILDLEIPWE